MRQATDSHNEMMIPLVLCKTQFSSITNMKSLTYWHPLIYTFLIRLSYGRGYNQRYQAIADLVEARSSLVDVCCGDSRIYSFLREKDIDYTGLDFNQCFVDKATKKGIRARLFDIRKDPVPQGDYILMQASLYQFYPNQHEIIRKLLDASSKALILSEPMKNKAHSQSKAISLLGVLFSNPGDGIKEFKFNPETLKETLRPFARNIKKEFLTANDIEYVVMLAKYYS